MIVKRMFVTLYYIRCLSIAIVYQTGRRYDSLRKNKLLKPVLKWVGGKRQLVDEIEKRLPKGGLYVEPFVGGGAILLNRQPQLARINDFNDELINVYKVIKDNPDKLLSVLKIHEKKNEEQGSEWYYEVRSRDREPEFKNMNDVDRAARIIYLNKTCFNGMFRVNSAGQLNVPYGRYKHPNIVNEIGIRALSNYLNESKIEIMCGDFADALIGLPKDAIVYLDPPYMPINETSSFTGYTQGGFGYDEQVRLRDECVKLREAGIFFLESNSDCPEIRDLYDGFKIETVSAKRSINSRGDRRGAVKEVLISG